MLSVLLANLLFWSIFYCRLKKASGLSSAFWITWGMIRMKWMFFLIYLLFFCCIAALIIHSWRSFISLRYFVISKFHLELSIDSFMWIISKFSWYLSGSRRLSAQHEKGTVVAFPETFSIKTTWSWPFGGCNANAHSPYASSCLSKWPKLGGCWSCYYKNNCW